MINKRIYNIWALPNISNSIWIKKPKLIRIGIIQGSSKSPFESKAPKTKYRSFWKSLGNWFNLRRRLESHGFLRLHVCCFSHLLVDGGCWSPNSSNIPRHQVKFGQEWYPCLAYLPIYTWLYLVYMFMTNVLYVNIPYIDNMGWKTESFMEFPSKMEGRIYCEPMQCVIGISSTNSMRKKAPTNNNSVDDEGESTWW